jgi:hypothetical protein
MDYRKSEEKLMRSEIRLTQLKKSSEQLRKSEDKISVSCKTPESLSINFKNLTLPLPVTGDLLGVGRHGRKYYTAEDLKWMVEFHKGKTFPIKFDHKDKEAGSTIGGVDKIYWKEDTQTVGYDGHINDATHAYNILDKLAKFVSGTFLSNDVYDNKYGLRGTEPQIKELSIVEEAAFAGSSINAVE